MKARKYYSKEYPVRSYSDKEIDEFLALDKEETKKLKKRKKMKKSAKREF